MLHYLNFAQHYQAGLLAKTDVMITADSSLVTLMASSFHVCISCDVMVHVSTSWATDKQ
jgi:hypothetical protein